ncbi:MAG TPA: DUF420 domain-containing protein [Chthoniobacteraceae bacterium]|nr:DUF420 domain-containing protein [Chthoniobacteraceae bacterium]
MIDWLAALTLRDLPGINASFNFVSTCFICLGWWFIRREQKRRHIAMMIGALISSTFFLAGYVVYHANVPPTEFEATGPIRLVYYVILASHILLAFTVLPLVLTTVIPAVRGRFAFHRRIGRWTMPVWLYVSVTGVLVYLMLYQWFPPSTLLLPHD